MPSVPVLRIVPDSEWAQAAAQELASRHGQAMATRGRCLLALSGGSTPTTLYDRLTRPDWRDRLAWDRTHFLFGDERCVPADHPDSNFGMAQRHLFAPLHIPSTHVSRMKGEREPAAAADEYEADVRALTQCAPPGAPELDIILLGLGEDGHIASLFPGTAALHEQRRLVTVGHAPSGVRLRLTMTLAVINRASVVLFLVAGAAKAAIVRAVLEPRSEAERGLPAAMVAPMSGQVTWVLDRAAAAQLSRDPVEPGKE